MDKIIVTNIFAAVSDKSVLDPLLGVLDSTSARFWGTEGTVQHLQQKGFSAKSVVAGFDFDGRVKSLDKLTFARILADRTNRKHLNELERLSHVILSKSEESQRSFSEPQDDSEPFDLVVVDLYPLDEKNFPESMDIGGQALIRAAIKNYKNVALAFDKESIGDLVSEIRKNNGSISLQFRKSQAKKSARFISKRCNLELRLITKI